MLVSEFIEQLNKLNPKHTIRIELVDIASIAYSPSVNITGAYTGIDWDMNTVFISTDSLLTKAVISQKESYLKEIKYQVEEKEKNKEYYPLTEANYDRLKNKALTSLNNAELSNISLTQLRQINNILNQTITE